MTDPTRTAARGAAFWICYAVVLIGAGLGLTWSIMALAAGGIEDADALYAASRSIGLLVIALVTPLFRSDDALLALAAVLTIVLGIDAYAGVVEGDWSRTAWPAVLCLVTIVTASFLARSDRVRGRG